MNPSKFHAERKTGELVRISTPTGPDYAFIPQALPPVWNFPEALYPKLIKARAALAKLDGIGRTIPEPDLLLVPLKRQEAIASSRLEGTHATAQELLLFELSDGQVEGKEHQVGSWREVHNYSRALARGIARLNELPFCGKLFKELHAVLMDGVRGQMSTPGEWRDHQVAIGSDRRFVPPPVPAMRESLDQLERYINEPSPIFDPLVGACLVHYQFEAIHPFGDGNGRIGRVILALMIAEWCDLSAPWLYLSPFFERFKEEYMAHLFNVSANGDWEPWVDFCLTGTIYQAKDAIDRCLKLGELRDKMLERVRLHHATRRSEQIIHSLFRNPVVRAVDLVQSLKVSHPTAQADLDRLVRAGVLSAVQDSYPRAFFAPEILRIAYGEVSY